MTDDRRRGSGRGGRSKLGAPGTPRPAATPPPLTPTPRPIRNDREWGEALEEVTSQDIDDAFSAITFEGWRADPEPAPEPLPAAAAVEVTMSRRPLQLGENTQPVLDSDIQEVLEIVRVEEAASAALMAPAPSEPPRRRRRTFSLEVLIASVILSSTISFGLGAALMLLALGDPSIHQRLLPSAAAPEVAGLRPAAPPPEAPMPAPPEVVAPHPEAASEEPAAIGDSAAADAGDEPLLEAAAGPEPPLEAGAGPDAEVLSSNDGGLAEASPAETVASATLDAATVDADLPPAASEGALDDGVPESLVLPMIFTRGRNLIVRADRDRLRALAEAIVAEPQTRFELIGFASPEEADDEEALSVLRSRRAVKAVNLLRSFGPSSHRFRARAARADEAQPVVESGEGEFGAVLMRATNR